MLGVQFDLPNPIGHRKFGVSDAPPFTELMNRRVREYEAHLPLNFCRTRPRAKRKSTLDAPKYEVMHLDFFKHLIYSVWYVP